MRHYVGRTTKLVVCSDCSLGNCKDCSSLIVELELEMLCHCPRCGGKCKSPHTEKVRQSRKVKARTGTTLEEMGF